VGEREGERERGGEGEGERERQREMERENSSHQYSDSRVLTYKDTKDLIRQQNFELRNHVLKYVLDVTLKTHFPKIGQGVIVRFHRVGHALQDLLQAAGLLLHALCVYVCVCVYLCVCMCVCVCVCAFVCAPVYAVCLSAVRALTICIDARGEIAARGDIAA